MRGFVVAKHKLRRRKLGYRDGRFFGQTVNVSSVFNNSYVERISKSLLGSSFLGIHDRKGTVMEKSEKFNLVPV
jgi:hypothetical protein